jgi:hypothetical protein
MATDSGEVAARVAALEQTLSHLTRGPGVRLVAITAGGEQVAAQERKPFHERYAWIFGGLAWFLGGAGSFAMFMLGYYLKDAVELDIKQRQLALSSAQAVQQLILQLGLQRAADERTATAIALANFGDLAIPPLIYQLRLRDETDAEAGMEGLRAVGVIAGERTCAALADVLDKNVALYPSQSHQRGAKLLGDLHCKSGAKALQAYRDYLHQLDPAHPGTFTEESVKNYQRRIQGSESLTASQLEEIAAVVDRALAKVEDQPK